MRMNLQLLENIHRCLGETFDLDEGYKEVRAKFGDDSEGVIEDFKELLKRNIIKDANEKNIDYWGKQGFDKFKSFVTKMKDVKSNTTLKKERMATPCEGAVKVFENDKYVGFFIKNYDASKFMGREFMGSSTTWCVSTDEPKYFNAVYKGTNLVYYVSKTLPKTDPEFKIAMVEENGKLIEVRNSKNDSIDKTEIWDLIGITNKQFFGIFKEHKRDEYISDLDMVKLFYEKIENGDISKEVVEKTLKVFNRFCNNKFGDYFKLGSDFVEFRVPFNRLFYREIDKSDLRQLAMTDYFSKLKSKFRDNRYKLDIDEVLSPRNIIETRELFQLFSRLVWKNVTEIGQLGLNSRFFDIEYIKYETIKIVFKFGKQYLFPSTDILMGGGFHYAIHFDTDLTDLIDSIGKTEPDKIMYKDIDDFLLFSTGYGGSKFESYDEKVKFNSDKK
jgi:hypothetical protein